MDVGAGRAAVALAVLLTVVSWHSAWGMGEVWNVGGAATALGYGLTVTAATLVLRPWVAERLGRAPAWVLPALVAVVVAGLTAAFVVGVPPLYRDALGVGSDRADALGVALSRLADGLYPYGATTYLGNPITPLPGALLLAAPFWGATGYAGWQNPVWLLLLLAVLRGRRPLRARPTLTWVLVAVGGLEVLREFLVGDDLVTGAVPAVAALAWTLRVADGRSTAAVAAVAMVLGVTTCTRPHLVLVLVVVFAAVGVRAGARRALLVGGCAGLAWVVLIVPFLLGGLARFSPLHVVAKVTGDRAVTVGIVVVALVAVVLLVAALAAARPSTTAGVGWCCAAVLFTPSVLSLVKGLVVGPTTDIDLTLGAAAVPFAVWAMAAGNPNQSTAVSEPLGPEAVELR